MATLKGQSIVVVGGSSGIGYGVALACLQSQAQKVIIASSSPEKVAAAKEKLDSEKGDGSPGSVVAATLDVKDFSAIDTFFEAVGEIDHLVFTSGDHLRMVDFKTSQVDAMKEAIGNPGLEGKKERPSPEDLSRAPPIVIVPLSAPPSSIALSFTHKAIFASSDLI